jgi:hypothetical protein
MIPDSQKIQIALASFLAGVVLAFIVYPKPEEETVYKFTTKTEVDTVFVNVTDTVHLTRTKIKTQTIRDTVLVDYKPSIKKFEASKSFEYGETSVSGEVLGDVLNIDIKNKFAIPVVTNTITNTETKTIIKKSKGVYLGANINSLLQPGATASYVDDKYIFQYQYQPLQKIHQIGVSKKLL